MEQEKPGLLYEGTHCKHEGKLKKYQRTQRRPKSPFAPKLTEANDWEHYCDSCGERGTAPMQFEWSKKPSRSATTNNGPLIDHVFTFCHRFSRMWDIGSDS